MNKQLEATRYIKNLLSSRSFNIDPGIVLIGEEGWQVFDYQSRCIGIDPNAGLWIGSGQGWKSLGFCTVSNSLHAVDFLTDD
jgi:hypothetical protein